MISRWSIISSSVNPQVKCGKLSLTIEDLIKLKKNEEDQFFDEYIQKPENQNKALALYHASKLVEYIPDSEKDNYRYAIESTILAYEANKTCAERLTKYFEAIQRFRADS